MIASALRALCALVLLLGLAVAQAASAQPQRRVALVIGNGAYQHGGALRNPANDARRMDEVLRRAGFEVILGIDLDRRGMEARIRDFGDRLEGGQLGLFFYAGHGIQVGGENHLLPVDARLQRERDLGLEAVPLSLVLRSMESAAPINLIFLDACRDNPLARSLARSMGTRSAAVGQGLAQVQSGAGTLVSFATAPGNVALDDEGTANSPFTTALSEHLTTPGQDVGLAMRRVRDAVLTATGRRQVPWEHSSLTGEVVLVPAVPGPSATTPPAVVAVPVPPAQPQPIPSVPSAPQVDREVLSWQSALAGGRSGDFEAYLQAYPNGTFAPLARNRLAELVVPRPQPPPPQGTGFPVEVGQVFRDCPDCPEMVVIPPGSFTMGAPDTESEARGSVERPQRLVSVRQALAVGRFHVTVAEYRRFVAATRRPDGATCGVYEHRQSPPQWQERAGRSWRTPGFTQGENHPVVCVNWQDARAYVAWLSTQTGLGYRLLTEAEWEYAARAGTTTRYWWGSEDGEACRFANLADQTGFPGMPAFMRVAQCRDGHARTSPVGSFPANRFGLGDMAGNAWQWVEDCYAESYVGAPSDAAVAVASPECNTRVLRGGSWGIYPDNGRASVRAFSSARDRSAGGGFRVARTPGG